MGGSCDEHYICAVFRMTTETSVFFCFFLLMVFGLKKHVTVEGELKE